MSVAEGTVSFRGYRTWYQVVGELPSPVGKLPLVVVNGGPGCPHDYMQDLAASADESGRPVVFYDQLGCGRSDHPDDPALWVMDTFVEEVAAVREALGLGRMHLLGHSWGSQVTLEYALGRPAGLAGLVLASPLASAPAYEAEARRLKQSLPPEVQEVIDQHEAEGTTGDDAYERATMEFYKRWLCRLDPWPDHLLRSFTNWRQDVYETMWGTEWNITGNLKDWDVTARLGELELPVLITSGRHDVTTPAVVRPLADGIQNAEWVIFEQSAHLASAEETECFRQVLESFLSRVEAADPGL
ncbi:proline iminopeptidase-family hydrolase [Streptomyces sp. NBC_00287]|uniref:proline iminopeptidase-family hydrolase n=1 Tax=Streptomyces sp. NBC_00287 TaxID=2975702 RepID=UPI002E28C5D3|nr:proline iminopeptidase-family hydrolase [Streptomyces sp. NBC_00287]